MKHFSLMLGAVGAFFILSPAQAADFRVIQWNASRACQIYDFSWGFRPIPPDYKVLTKSLPTYAAALSAKMPWRGALTARSRNSGQNDRSAIRGFSSPNGEAG